MLPSGAAADMEGAAGTALVAMSPTLLIPLTVSRILLSVFQHHERLRHLPEPQFQIDALLLELDRYEGI